MYVGAEKSTGISVLEALWNKEEKERIQRGSFGTLGWGVIIFSQATRRAAAVTHNPSAIPCFPAPSDFPQTSIRSTYAILFSFPPARSLIRTPPLKSTWTRTSCILELWYDILTRWSLILQESYYKGIDHRNKCYHSMTLFYRYKRCYSRMLFPARLVVMHFCDVKFPINAWRSTI